MAKRQDTGSNSAHENEQPTSHNEDAIPEMKDPVRGRADDEESDEFEEDDEFDTVDEEDESDESL